MNASGACSSPATMSSRYLSWPARTSGAAIARMVDRRIEAELALDIAAFLHPAGDADDPRALALGKLSSDRADRTRGGGDDDGLAGFRLADIGEADIGGHPRHAEDAERGR